VLSRGAPNIVPGTTSALYDPRASDDEPLQQRGTRLPAYFEAEALTTGYTHEVTQVSRLVGPHRQLVRLQRHQLIGSVCQCRVALAPAAGGTV
jgi:metal-dependent amidase/aminoacylase/carboxypeptidase family protein